MSGCSYDTDCPRCGGKNTVMASSDWKPFDTSSGTCIKCGFSYYTKCYIADKKELLDFREDFQPSEPILPELKRKKGAFKEFDKNWCE